MTRNQADLSSEEEQLTNCVKCGKLAVTPLMLKRVRNPRWCHECSRKNAFNVKIKLKNQILDHYGRSCICCGETNVAFLVLDHKNGNGNTHRKEIIASMKNAKAGSDSRYGGAGMYRWVIKHNFPEDFQILCYNCNCAKAYWPGGCPHGNC